MWGMPGKRAVKLVDAPVLFKTLSDSTRLRLLNLLAAREVCVCDLHTTLNVVQPKVSRHLARLKAHGLIEARRDGRWTHYRLATHGDPLVRNVLEYLTAWMQKQDTLIYERRKLRKVCCANARRKISQTKARGKMKY